MLNYAVRPWGENEQDFWIRVAGLEPQDMTLDDFMRACAYQYLAGGERRQRLVAEGLGSHMQRDAYWRARQ